MACEKFHPAPSFRSAILVDHRIPSHTSTCTQIIRTLFSPLSLSLSTPFVLFPFLSHGFLSDETRSNTHTFTSCSVEEEGESSESMAKQSEMWFPCGVEHPTDSGGVPVRSSSPVSHCCSMLYSRSDLSPLCLRSPFCYAM